MHKDFLKLSDHTPETVRHLVNEAVKMKKKPDGKKPLTGKTIGLIFTKSSTRTRTAFEAGMYQLGGHVVNLRPDEIQLTRGETHHDTAKVMSRYLDGLVVRTFAQDDVEALAQYASIPVINALTDKYHPCQAIADYATLLDNKKTLKGLTLAYIGDGNNVAHSLILGGALLGVSVAVATPKNYRPAEDVWKTALDIAKKTGAKLTLTGKPAEAAKNADALYTDVWVSMGQEAETKKRRNDFAGYIIDQALLKKAASGCIVMHCLPAHRGEEIAADVIDGPQSVVFDQAEYKLHAQKAVLKLFVGDT
ncbi:MAG: ornithine carbamoyltransferase [Nitrospinae bacterium]|nr:ornithine carbamoyltransferase [Nitrospinota bacterium]